MSVVTLATPPEETNSVPPMRTLAPLARPLVRTNWTPPPETVVPLASVTLVDPVFDFTKTENNFLEDFSPASRDSCHLEPLHLGALGRQLAFGDSLAVERAQEFDSLRPAIEQQDQRFVPRARVADRGVRSPPQKTARERVVGCQVAAIEATDRTGQYGHDLRDRAAQVIEELRGRGVIA